MIFFVDWLFFLGGYIILFLGDNMKDIFCRIIAREIPSRVIFEDEVVKVIMDVSPRSNGHLLVLPKDHYQDLYDISDNVLSHIMSVARKMGELLTEKLGCEGITLEQNNGISQEVKHFHLHIIPKYTEEVAMDIEEVFNKITL